VVKSGGLLWVLLLTAKANACARVRSSSACLCWQGNSFGRAFGLLWLCLPVILQNRVGFEAAFHAVSRLFSKYFYLVVGVLYVNVVCSFTSY
jgi:hypothetical protein